MPQILAIPAYLAGGLTQIAATAGATLATQAAISTVATAVFSIIGLGITIGLSLLLRPPVPEPSDGQLETQQAVPPRTFIYGRMLIAGAIGFKETGTPPHEGQLWKICLMHDGEVDAYESIYTDDKLVKIDENGWVTNAGIQDAEQHYQLFLHKGEEDQEADADMLLNFPEVWTTDHRLRGIAYIVAVFWGTSVENFNGAYPNGEPVVKATIRGRRVWDPRDETQILGAPNTWLWSDNAALCVLDWIAIHPKGYKIPIDKIAIASFVVMANRCDELIPLSTGGSEKRYRVATQVSLKEPRTDVLARLREACDGHLYLTGDGKWAIRGGEWTEPTVTIDTELGHVIDLEMKDGMDALQRYNELSLRFISPNHEYTEAECDAWQGTSDPEFMVGKVKTETLDLLQVPSYTQARRLAKIMMAFDNPAYIGKATTNFYGLNAVGERNITLNWSEPGEAIDGPFWVEPDLQLSGDVATVSISLRSADPTAYDWDPETEEGEPVPLLPPTDVEFEEGVAPDPPTDFAVTAGVREVICSWYPAADPELYIMRVWRSAVGAGFANAYEVSGPRYRPYHWPDPSTDIMSFTDPSTSAHAYYLTGENAVGDRTAYLGPLVASGTTSGEFFILDDKGNRLMDDAGNFLTTP